ncbi:MAG: YbhB/YbcL family Raf kinase inhibitor-like protein [Mucilaginibacter sp.]|uniref:YbhB/YbcL family Raf kinase inhibitor-like protein n=1 Tax=Mucilaginibacter sp. TaxID=1882438 RepID=UPI0032664B2E
MKTLFYTVFAMLITFSVNAQTFTLKSNDLGGQFSNEFSLNGFGCSGANKSPQLYWENAPKDAKSFAITIHDPAAPTGSGWWHWVVFDIPATITEVKQGAGSTNKQLMPATAIQSNTDFGQPGYGGPCPPVGDAPHPYIITVYALTMAKLGLDKNASAAYVGFALSNNLISKASLIVYFKR